MASELELRTAWIALVAAALDGTLDTESVKSVILRRDEGSDFAYAVLVYSARVFAAATQDDAEVRAEFRAELGDELYRLAALDGTEPR